MAKGNIKIDIELKEQQVVKDLIELLSTKFDELPKEMQEKIMQIEESGLHNVGVDELERLYGHYKEYKTSFPSKNIININKVLKRVFYIVADGKSITEHTAYPDHFWHSFDGKKVIEW